MSTMQIHPEVGQALAAGRPVVALETTLISHGFPHPEGAAVARESEAQVRARGAVPATIGVVDGVIRVGLSDDELLRFSTAGLDARKLGPRDIAACVVQKALGATTVGSTLAIAQLAGIRFMATGGLGGVHRGFPAPADVSADLAELTRSAILVVSSGVKSILDVAATSELLETLSIPVLGWRTDVLPLFYAATGGPPVSVRVEAVDEAAAIAREHWQTLRRGSAVLLARPPVDSLDDIDPLIEAGLAAAAVAGVSGQGVTPFLLGYLHENSDGRTAAANKQLIVDNAALAAEVAVAYTAA